MINRVEAVPSSVDTDGTISDDGSYDSFNGGNRNERKNRRRRRKGESSKRSGRLHNEVKRMLTPVVKVLLFGVLLSLLDALYIIKHLEEASEIEPNATLKSSSEVIGEKIESTEIKVSDPNNPINGREPIVKLIRDAGIEFDPVKDADLIQELPLWSEVVELYGPKPIIHGLSQGNCERFQASGDKGDHLIGTAGTFNTGTNLLSELLIANCIMPERMKKHGNASRGIRWQVPWGKHSPVGDKEYREAHKTKKDKDIDANDIMPMVTIRDPLIWLKSMCRHKYTAHWRGFLEPLHCPNFLMKDLETIVKYDGFKRSYESLLYLWNEYYEEYKNVDIPFLLVRFEDLVFHPVETVTQVCECGGGMLSHKKFKYIVNSAKKGDTAHGAMSQRTGFVDALVKYGSIDKRYKGFDSKDDLEYVKDHINQSIMDIMQYSSIDPSYNENKKQESPI